MNTSLIKPVLIVITGLFILIMLNGCVVAPYRERVVVKSPPHHHYHHHHGKYPRRGWR